MPSARTALLVMGLALLGRAQGAENQLSREMLAGKRFRFSWRGGAGGRHIGVAVLRADGTIAGIRHPNETTWRVDEKGRLTFLHRDGRVSTIFTRAERRDGKWVLAGPFQFKPDVLHVLEETPEEGEMLNRKLRLYSAQRIVCLDVDEVHRLRLTDGSERAIRLVSVAEKRDSVIKLVRQARVNVEVDGRPVELTCSPYAMPTEVAGIKLQADTTSGWLAMPKRVQLSIWEAGDPVVDARRFVFPLRDYALFSHGLQSYNEVVHLGRGDGDPKGQRFYHNYGIDMAGYEGRQQVVSCTDGQVARLWPDAATPSSVLIEDEGGLVWEYAHLDSVSPGITVGARVRKAQPIGVLGKRGGSGNFSHLHLGVFPSRGDLEARRRTLRLNLYPWIVTAHQQGAATRLHAVARPHQVLSAGETATLDGSRSLAFGAKIASYRWVFHDGQTTDGVGAQRTYEEPGVYIATLWVEDERGHRDVDFCRVKVFSTPKPEDRLPTIFMTHAPTRGIVVDQPVRVRCWVQTQRPMPMVLDFGDGSVLADYRSYAEVTHRFAKPGIHVVTARTAIGGKPIAQKQKIVVQPRPPAQDGRGASVPLGQPK